MNSKLKKLLQRFQQRKGNIKLLLREINVGGKYCTGRIKVFKMLSSSVSCLSVTEAIKHRLEVLEESLDIRVTCIIIDVSISFPIGMYPYWILDLDLPID